MKKSRILRYWEAFQRVSGVIGEYCLAEQFGYGKQLGDDLANLIKSELVRRQPLLLLWNYTKKMRFHVSVKLLKSCISKNLAIRVYSSSHF